MKWERQKAFESFVNKCLKEEPSNVIKKEEIYNAYREYCQQIRAPAFGKKGFSMMLTAYIKAVDSNTTRQGKKIRTWRGIALAES